MNCSLVISVLCYSGAVKRIEKMREVLREVAEPELKKIHATLDRIERRAEKIKREAELSLQSLDSASRSRTSDKVPSRVQ